MYEPKKDIYTILKSVTDNVYQNFPEASDTLPCISFYMEGNTPTYTLDKEIGFQDISVIVDIWAKTSKETGELLISLESEMLENDFRMVFSSDLPEDNLSHVTTRFNLIY
jgi:hypothetical protein